MSKSAYILAPTSLATQLSALTGRPVVVKSVPHQSANGRPIDPEASRARSLRRAVEAFNA